MTKIIQATVDANGDVHLDFSGFVGRDCQAEEHRLRRDLAALGLDVDAKFSPKPLSSHTGNYQQSSSPQIQVQ